jgi:surface polysaccharide O-acyltransferase-like enzyme
MKLQPPNTAVMGGSKFPSAGLSACILGMAFVPFAYIAIGALSAFAVGFAFLTVPILLVAAGYLFYRLLAKPPRPADSSVLPRIGETLCWILIAAFVTLVSSFNLLTRFERIGLTCTLFLASFVLALPVVLLRPTALQDRIRSMARSSILVWLVAILAVTITTAFVFMIRPAAFL